MNYQLIKADARKLDMIPDNSVDLVITSPPYFSLRNYKDGEESLEGQIGAEPSPREFLEALWEVTAECKRVIKPTGSIFVNLGDKYAGSGGHNNSNIGAKKGRGPSRYTQESSGIPAKSLMLLPERYRIGCVDDLGLIARAVIVWDKPNGLPESVTDRVRRSHEDWVHLTKEPRYFAAVDEVREPLGEWSKNPRTRSDSGDGGRGAQGLPGYKDIKRSEWTEGHPLGKLPGSVWTVASEPLRVPPELGVEHFAAFPQEWPRKFILGWSPSGICQECGEGRKPTADVERTVLRRRSSERSHSGANGQAPMGGYRGDVSRVITGYSCACTEATAPTFPAVVLDPFCGTGTTIMVARALGRFGIGVDLSSDYLRLARWRIDESDHVKKTIECTYGKEAMKKWLKERNQ